MTQREKTAHLLRRFGLGAVPNELDEFEKLGPDKTLDRLLDYDKVDEGFPVSPWELCMEEGKSEIYLDPFRTVAWWSLRLLLTKRPLQEKLTLFWHNHFAVSAQKVEFGPMMLDYLEALRSNASGNFTGLLKAASKTPAMLRWLDGDENTRGHPNENFAREVMELFTIGKGAYTEKDVTEAARAFTGWGIRYLLFERGGEKVQETARDFITNGRPMTAFCETPDLHDTGPKTILGQTKSWTGDEVLEMLASRPKTAKLIAKKLWEFFAYPEPEAKVVDHIARVFLDTKGDIKSVMRAIAKSDEFWSDKCVRAIVKSPADFTIPVIRQFEVGDLLRSLYKKPATPLTPLPKALRDSSGIIFGLMYQQGMTLLYPPDVSGWHWGKAWITSNNMLQRIKVADAVFGTYNNEQPLAAWLAARLTGQNPLSTLNVRGENGQSKTRTSPRTPKELVDALVETFDAPVPAEKRAVLIEACEKAGGPAALAKPATAAQVFSAVCRLMFGMPEFQFC